MTNCILIFFVVILAQALIANQDVWKGGGVCQKLYLSAGLRRPFSV